MQDFNKQVGKGSKAQDLSGESKTSLFISSGVAGSKQDIGHLTSGGGTVNEFVLSLVNFNLIFSILSTKNVEKLEHREGMSFVSGNDGVEVL